MNERIERTLAALAATERAAAGDVDPVIAELGRLRVAQLLRNEVELARRSSRGRAAGLAEDKIADLARWPTAATYSPAERAALAFVEQFVMDVNGVDDAMVGALLDTMAPEVVYAFARAVHATEARQRVELVGRHDADLADGLARCAELALSGGGS